MTSIADRHSGTLNGQLSAEYSAMPNVTVVLQAQTANLISVQHTAWMLINLLARLQGTISQVSLHVPHGVALAPGVVPSADQHGLLDTLLTAGERIAGVPIQTGYPGGADGPGLELHVGPGVGVTRGLRVHGEGFCGAIAQDGISSCTDSTLPFGPYVAACLAAGEIFRRVRVPVELAPPTSAISFSLWDYSLGDGDLHEPGPATIAQAVTFGLAGVGAVGNAAVLALWACADLQIDAVLADGDPDGVDVTNLNRCVLFDRRHIGEHKASTAADICARPGAQWRAVDDIYTRANVPDPPDLLVSAVDTNKSRHSLQQGFWPARLLAASTKNLRAEVVRLGPPGVGPCLCCGNDVEVDLPDNVVRNEIAALDDSQVTDLAEKLGVEASMIRRWAHDGDCGEVGDAVAAEWRDRAQSPMPSEFSVGFVSVFAGTALAAEIVKEHAPRVVPLDDERPQAKFQFLRPTAPRNGIPGPRLRSPRCPVCAAEAPATAIWRDRWATWLTTNGT